MKTQSERTFSNNRGTSRLTILAVSIFLLSGCAQLKSVLEGSNGGNANAPIADQATSNSNATPANQANANTNANTNTNTNTNTAATIDEGAVFVNKAEFKDCEVETGWKTCKEMSNPTIRIYTSRLASESALNGVANTYHQMTKRFGDKYPKDKFNDYKVYLTNGEPWSELSGIAPIGKLWPDKTGPMSGDFLRGGTTANFLWIDEQMLCKTGVKTRNEAGTPDKTVRTLDQVVHEFGHAIAYRYNLDGVINSDFDGNAESFPWSIQYWFGTPNGSLNPKAEAVIKNIFSSRISLKCEGYKP